MASEAAILLKDVQWERRSKILWTKSVKAIVRGELLILLPRDKVVPRKDGSPAHNYQLASDPAVTLYCPEDDVAPLSDYEYNLMNAIKSQGDRYEVFQKDLLDWGSKLKVGDFVYATLPSNSPLSDKKTVSRIEYIGPLPNEDGVQFGVEITNPNHRNQGSCNGFFGGEQFFTCENNCGLFISLGRLSPLGGQVNPQELPQPPRNDQEHQVIVRLQPRVRRSNPGQQNIRLKYSTDQPRRRNCNTDQQRRKTYNTDQQRQLNLHHKSKFKLDDRVVVYGKDHTDVHGSVRWIGNVNYGGEDYSGIGIEMDVGMQSREYPGSLPGHSHYFECKDSRHDKLVMLEAFVVFEHKNAARKGKGATRSGVDAHSTKEKCLSAEDDPENWVMISASVLSLEQKMFHSFSVGSSVKVNDKVPQYGVIKWIGNIPNIQEHCAGLELEEPMEGCGDGSWNGVQYFSCRQGYASFCPLSSLAPDQRFAQTTVTDVNPLEYLAFEEEQGCGGQPSDGGQTAVYAPKQDFVHSFSIGSTVQLFSKEPRYGVIQWMGTIPAIQGRIAGVELDEPMDGCGDGALNGVRYFSCCQGHGFFCPLSFLTPDQRFAQTIVTDANPLDYVAFEEECDQHINVGQISQYIGESKGIQGQQNSCYLDSTVFGLFAVSDAFDNMFLQQLQGDSAGDEVKHLLWKGIVNPLRKNGVVRHESVMRLCNKLEELGKMKGVNQDEKDPEEFLNMLFKHTLHVPPFINIKRPHGVEQEYFVQLFVEPDDSIKLPTVQDLISRMFKEQRICFTKVPSKLLIQVPCYGREVKSNQKNIASLNLNVKNLLCSKPGPGTVTNLELLSVICIETSHYVCFTRSEDKWVFFDSMANRVGMYNIPKVVDCTDALNEWVYPLNGDLSRLINTPPRGLPEYVRRFTQDIYLCVYIHPNMGSNKNSPENSAAIEQELVELQEKNTILRQENETLCTEVTELKQECLQLKEEKAAYQREAVEKESQHQMMIEQIQARMQALDQQLQEKERQIWELEGKLKAADEEAKEVGFTQLLHLETNDSSWNFQRSEVTVGEEIGRGASGLVSKGTFRRQTVAVKQIHEFILTQKHVMDEFKREVRIMASIQHPNLVRFIGAVFDESVENLSATPLLILELLHTNLRRAYERFNLSPIVSISIFRDVAYGLHYLHEHQEPIIHRDVSAPNILLEALPGGMWRAKLSDFGSANFLKRSSTLGVGAIVCTAPEMFPRDNLSAPMPRPTTKCDVFSYGIVLVEVITKTMPSPENRHQLFIKVQRNWRMMHDLISQCTQPLPQNRPSMLTVLNSLNQIPVARPR